MTPRQARLGADIFTGLVIASVGLALATLTWRLQGYTGAGPVAAPVAPGGGQALDVGPVLALAPFGTASAVSSDSSVGSLELRAIFAAIPTTASVALIAGSDGIVTSYGIGESVGGGVIEQILPEQVVLRTATGLQTISIGNEDDGRAGQGISTRPGVPVPGVPATASPSQLPAPPAPAAPPATSAPASGVDAIRSLIPRSARGGTTASPPAPALSPAENVPQTGLSPATRLGDREIYLASSMSGLSLAPTIA
ncbi:MAG: type II secretion system protein N [Alteraurantiacibacter sp.]